MYYLFNISQASFFLSFFFFNCHNFPYLLPVGHSAYLLPHLSIVGILFDQNVNGIEHSCVI